MTQAPMFWLQHIEKALEVVKEVPLWGSSPPFPWEKCSEQIATHFQLSNLKVEHKKTHFLSFEELTSGLGTSPVKIPVELTPLPGCALWLMASEDVAKLTQLVLSPQNGMKGFASPQFQEGFYRYVLLNVLEKIDEMKVFGDLSSKMGTAMALPQDGALCIDVAINHPKAYLWGRLICPPNFHQAFKDHFTQKPASLFKTDVASEIPLSLKLEIAHTSLSYSQFKTIERGDFLVLDRCSYDPMTHKGTVTVVLEKTPLFRARLKENQLKIVEYAYYYEEEPYMDNDFSEEEGKLPPEEEDFESSESEEDEELPEEDQEHLWSSDRTDQADVEKLVQAHDVPLTLSVEVSRLNMNLEKLLQLKPGNMIELPVRPEQGVDLVLNGKKVAKGELIKIGEVLGVKILQIGS